MFPKIIWIGFIWGIYSVGLIDASCCRRIVIIRVVGRITSLTISCASLPYPNAILIYYVGLFRGYFFLKFGGLRIYGGANLMRSRVNHKDNIFFRGWCRWRRMLPSSLWLNVCVDIDFLQKWCGEFGRQCFLKKRVICLLASLFWDDSYLIPSGDS